MLKIKNLTLKYKSTGQKVLNNLSLEIKKGEVVALLGPSGCGKTTLLNYIQGILEEKVVVASGMVEIEPGTKIRTVFQEPRLLPWLNALRNVSFGLEASGVSRESAERISKKTLATLGLSKYANYFPSQLSVGMKQRINFGRALATNPDILLLDEPFSSLDDKTKQQVQGEFLRVINLKNIAVLFVTHDVKEAKKLADRIINLQKNSKSLGKNEKK